MADSQEFRRKFFLGNFTFLGILVLILIALYFLADLLSAGKLDFTGDKLYTISPGTKKILSGLIDKIQVKYHCTDPLPATLQNLRRDTQDLFEEFRDLSNGKFEYSIVNPETEASEYAAQKVKEYYAEKESGKIPTEPKAPQRIEDIFSGRKPPEGDQVRENRAKLAATVAAQGGEDKAVVERRLLGQDWERNFYQNLEQEGIQARNLEVREASSVRFLKVFSAIEIKYLDKQPEVIPWYVSLEGLEYELSSRILKLTASEKPVVAFFDGKKPPAPPMNPMNPVRPPGSDYDITIKELGEFFEVRSIDLKEGDSIDDLVVRLKEDRKRKAEEESGEEPKKDDPAKEEDKKATPEDVKALIKCLVIAQPDQLESRQVYEISRAVSLGVPTIFLISRYSMDVSQQGVMRNGLPLNMLHTGLDDLFRKWGIEVGSDILASNQCAAITVPQNLGGLMAMLPAPLPVSVATAGPAIEQSSTLTNKISHLAFPATTGLKVLVETLQKSGIKSEILAKTVKETWSVKVDPFERLKSPLTKNQGIGASVLQYRDDLAERKRPEEFRDFIEPVALAVLLTGKMPFAFEGETVPAWKKEEKDESRMPPGVPGLPGGLPGGLPMDFEHGDRDLALNLLDPQDAKGEPPAPAPAPAPPGAQTPPAGGETPPPAVKAPDPAPPAVPTPSTGQAPAPAPEPGVTPAPAPGTGADAKPAEPAPPPEKANVTPADGKVLLLASVDMIKNDYLQQQSQEYVMGFRLMQNALENFGLSDDLMNIRRKQLTSRQFKPDSDGLSMWIMATNIAIVPLLVGLLGLIYYYTRRAESRAYERRYIQKTGT